MTLPKQMSEELALLNEWQNRLYLNDWFITLIYPCKPNEMDIQDADGCVNYAETLKAAIIQIIDEKESKHTLKPFDFEETLVHELLHLKFCLLENGEDWDRDLPLRILHQEIDELSRILVGLKRSKDGASD